MIGHLGFAMKQFRVYLLLWVLTLGCVVGCGPQQTEKQTQNSQSQLTGAEILEQMAESYMSAASYSDRAILYMTYRTEEGHPIQEPMPWSVIYEKHSQKFNGQFYNSVVKYDGQLLGCQIFDIETENQDNQYLLISHPNLPLEQLLKDPEAKRNMGGFSELPLRNDSSAIVSSLLPPTLALLTGQVDFPWLTRPNSVSRMEDQLIEGVVCFHVQTRCNNQPCDFWVEQETGLIHQILFPNNVLQIELEKLGRISDLKIVARFHECNFNQEFADNQFQVQPPESASLVTEFVTLPDVFPSELIGQETPSIALHTPTGQQVTNKTFSGKPTALLWVAGYGADTGIKTLNQIQRDFGNQVNFGILYSDAKMKDPSGTTFQPSDTFVRQLESLNSNTPLYCDFDLVVCSQLQIKAIPSILILDKDLKIHFVKAVAGIDWSKEVDATLQRVLRGEDVAQEVIDNYGVFYSRYRAKLKEVEFQFNKSALSAQNVSAPISRKRVASDIWTADTLLRPGNIATALVNGKTVIAALDGFRTVVLLDENGNQLLRKELELPENHAVTRLRVSSVQGKLVIAAFSKLGSQVHWFDDNLQPLGSFPQTFNPEMKIEDCQFAQSNGSIGLLVASKETGLYQVDLVTSASKKLTQRSAKEFCVTNKAVAGVENGSPFSSTLPDLKPSVFSAWHFSNIEGNRQLHPSDVSENFCALGTTHVGEWHAIGLDSQFTVTWKANIGEQDFQNDIEPLASQNEHNVWLIANSEHEISVVSSSGNPIYQLKVDNALNGIASLPNKDQLRFVYSTGSVIKCVEIKLNN